MVLFDVFKLIFQTCMRSHPVGLDVWFFVGLFVYFHTSCVRTAKALARLRGCVGSPEPSLVAYVISTIISWAGSYYEQRRHDSRMQIVISLEPRHEKTCLCHMRSVISAFVVRCLDSIMPTYIYALKMLTFNNLASLCSWAGWFESYLVIKQGSFARWEFLSATLFVPMGFT